MNFNIMKGLQIKCAVCITVYCKLPRSCLSDVWAANTNEIDAVNVPAIDKESIITP